MYAKIWPKCYLYDTKNLLIIRLFYKVYYACVQRHERCLKLNYLKTKKVVHELRGPALVCLYALNKKLA